MTALTIEERRALRGLAPTHKDVAKLARTSDATLKLALGGGLLAPPTIKRLRDAIAKGAPNG